MNRWDDVETRIAKLNEKLWDFRIPPGSTQFNNHTFTEQEKKILSLFDDLIEKYKPLTPPPDVLHKIQPLLDALRRIMLGRAVDIFAHTVKALLYIGEDERTQDFDLRLFEAQLWHFIFQRARDRHYEKTWTAAVTQVFGHTNYDALPDTEADPPGPGWVQVDALMDEYEAQLKRDDAEERRILKYRIASIKPSSKVR